MTLQAKLFAFVAPVLVVTALVPPAIWFGHLGGAQQDRAIFFEAVLMSVGLVLSALLAVHLAASRLVCGPMRQMAMKMRGISNGELKIEPLVEAKRQDEVGEVARAVNQLLDTAQWSTMALQASNTGLDRHVMQRTAELARRSEELALVDRKYRSIFDNGTEGIFQTTVDGHCLVANPAMVRMLGYDSEQQLTESVTNLAMQGYADPSVRDRFLKTMLSQGRVDNFEAEFVRRDKSLIWISICARAVRNEAGAVTHFEGFVRDITGQKHAEWLDQDRRLLLEMTARNEPLSQTLIAVCYAAERQWEKSRSMVLLCDGARKQVAAASELSDEFVQAMNENLGLVELSEGSDLFTLKDRFFADVKTDESWLPVREIARRDGLAACQSVPIVAGHGKLLGQFIVFRDGLVQSDERDLKAMHGLAGLAGLAIEHHQLTDRLEYDAVHDPLTGLPNRVQVETRLPQWIAAAARHKHPLALLMIDLDGFKHVNDTLGHRAGDELLRQVAGRLAKGTRESDVLVRMGGDEFMLVATELGAAELAGLIADRLIKALSAPFSIEGRELFVTTSTGIAVYPGDGEDSATLQRSADAAMYAAKAAGRNRSMRFETQMADAALERLELEGQLRRAITNNELQLEYQPQVDRNGALVGVEAVLRWQHPRLGRIPPMRFIPIAEQSGLIVPMGSWVLREACQQAKRWQEAGYGAISVAVNVSPMQFQQPDFLEIVSKVLRETGLEPRYLELEITESLLVANTSDAIEKVAAARAMGLGVAIDDFGTGYSSLAYLQKLPIDRLKIDQSFVRELGNGQTVTTDRSRTAIITAIASLAVNLGKGIVAEGVETVAQRDYLVELGCGTLQGYLFGKPMEAEGIERMMRRVGVGEGVMNVAA